MKRTSMISEEGRQPCTYRYRAWRRAAHSFLTSGATRDPWSPKALVLSTHESRMCFGTAAPVVGCGGRPQSVHARQNQDESRDHKSACATPTALVCGSCLNGFSVNPYTPVHFWAGVHAHSTSLIGSPVALHTRTHPECPRFTTTEIFFSNWRFYPRPELFLTEVRWVCISPLSIIVTCCAVASSVLLPTTPLSPTASCAK